MFNILYSEVLKIIYILDVFIKICVYYVYIYKKNDYFKQLNIEENVELSKELILVFQNDCYIRQ